MVAFANTDGGTLLIGVKDNGVIAGIRSEEEKYMVETAALLYTRPMVAYKTKEWEIEGKTVLEVKIPNSDTMPHYALEKDGKWMAYIRVKDQNLLANSVLLKVWQKRKQKEGILLKYTKDETLLLHYLEQNRIITLSQFSRIAQISYKKAENILVNLVTLDVLEMIFTEKEVYYTLNNNFN